MIMRMIRYIVAAVLIALAFAACDSEGDKFDYQKVGLLISGTEQVPVQRFTVEDLPAACAVRRVCCDCQGYAPLLQSGDRSLGHRYGPGAFL